MIMMYGQTKISYLLKIMKERPGGSDSHKVATYAWNIV